MSTIATILHVRARHHDWQGVGPLSIKSFYGGAARYEVAGGRHVVDGSCYLLLNAGQEYAITVDNMTPLESFCVFFAPGFAEEVSYTLNKATATLLDEPQLSQSAGLCFYERTYPHDSLVSPALAKLRRGLAGSDTSLLWRDEQLHLLMAKLLLAHRRIQQEVDGLPAIRAVTRDELYRRLYRARDYMVASLAEPVTLAEMAQVACLSPNHFLRTFKQLFRQSPYQYLLEQRLARAATLLQQTTLPVTEIASLVGFESLGSFSWRFRRHWGLAPEHYRRHHS
ncbi:MAG: AraC family transcriptional regulator [Caldilineaceae bacterium]